MNNEDKDFFSQKLVEEFQTMVNVKKVKYQNRNVTILIELIKSLLEFQHQND